MTDELYVIHSFEKHFSEYKHKKIVIYGKGPKTKLILDVFPDYNIGSQYYGRRYPWKTDADL